MRSFNLLNRIIKAKMSDKEFEICHFPTHPFLLFTPKFLFKSKIKVRKSHPEWLRLSPAGLILLDKLASKRWWKSLKMSWICKTVCGNYASDTDILLCGYHFNNNKKSKLIFSRRVKAALCNHGYCYQPLIEIIFQRSHLVTRSLNKNHQLSLSFG